MQKAVNELFEAEIKWRGWPRQSNKRQYIQDQLVRIFAQYPTDQSLCLDAYRIPFQRDEIEPLVQVLKGNTSLRRLEIREAYNCNLVNFPSEVLRLNTNIQDLCLLNSVIQMGVLELFETRAPFVNSLSKIIRVSVSLCRLSLVNYGLGELVVPLIDALKVNNSVRSLNLRGNLLEDITLAAFANLLSINTTLQCLELANNNFTDAAIASFFKACSPDWSLQSLDFTEQSDNVFGAPVEALVEINSTNNKSNLRCLSFECNSGNSLMAVAAIINQNPHLCRLLLDKIEPINEEAINCFIEALMHHKSLVSLELRGKINDELCAGIANVVVCNQNLHSLILRGIIGRRYRWTGIREIDSTPPPTLIERLLENKQRFYHLTLEPYGRCNPNQNLEFFPILDRPNSDENFVMLEYFATENRRMIPSRLSLMMYFYLSEAIEKNPSFSKLPRDVLFLILMYCVPKREPDYTRPLGRDRSIPKIYLDGIWSSVTGLIEKKTHIRTSAQTQCELFLNAVNDKAQQQAVHTLIREANEIIKVCPALIIKTIIKYIRTGQGKRTILDTLLCAFDLQKLFSKEPYRSKRRLRFWEIEESNSGYSTKAAVVYLSIMEPSDVDFANLIDRIKNNISTERDKILLWKSQDLWNALQNKETSPLPSSMLNVPFMDRIGALNSKALVPRLPLNDLLAMV